MLHGLSKEDLKKVTGGYVYNTGNISLSGGYVKYEVIDDKTGEVLQTAKGYNEAIRIAQQRGVGTREISKAQLNRLRETGSID